MRRAKARAEFLMQRAEEEQTRAEVYALNRLMRRREIMRFEAYVKARKLSRKRARAMRLAAEQAMMERRPLYRRSPSLECHRRHRCRRHAGKAWHRVAP